MALLTAVPDDEPYEGNVYDASPAVRPNWRVQPQTNLSHGEAATYRRLYHAPRMLNIAAVGLKDFSNRAAELAADDEYLAVYYTDWERRLANAIIRRFERYMDGDGY
jgi:hypothetical protein